MANDSWDGMLPVNINKLAGIPRLDLAMLQSHSEEDMFRVFDIRAPKSLEILGDMVDSVLAEKQNPIAPIDTLNHLRLRFNRAGYDFALTQDRVLAIRTVDNGFVDFPITSYTSELYPYQIDQRFPGTRVEDDGIESKLGYKISLRIHMESALVPSAISDQSGNPVMMKVKNIQGEIIPQE